MSLDFWFVYSSVVCLPVELCILSWTDDVLPVLNFWSWEVEPVFVSTSDSVHTNISAGTMTHGTLGGKYMDFY